MRFLQADHDDHVDDYLVDDDVGDYLVDDVVDDHDDDYLVDDDEAHFNEYLPQISV